MTYCQNHAHQDLHCPYCAIGLLAQNVDDKTTVTDGSLSTLSGLELFRWWIDEADKPCEEHAPDGSFVLHKATLDFDYMMGYLLEVRQDTVRDFLFCFRRHGDGPDFVQWRNQPHVFWPDDGGDNGRLAAKEWVDYCYAELDAYADELNY